MKRLHVLLALGLVGTPSLAADLPYGKILVNSSEPCSVEVDGKAVGAVENARDILEVRVRAGKHLVVAIHRDDPSSVFRELVEVWAGDAQYVLVELTELAPRFVDQGNGTVRDIETGLLWLKGQDCLGHAVTAASAMESVRRLHDGDCLLSDGSRPGAWRLPTKGEWETILAPGCSGDTARVVGRMGGASPVCFSQDPWADGMGEIYWVGDSHDPQLNTSSRCIGCLMVDTQTGFVIDGEAMPRPLPPRPRRYVPSKKCRNLGRFTRNKRVQECARLKRAYERAHPDPVQTYFPSTADVWAVHAGRAESEHVEHVD